MKNISTCSTSYRPFLMVGAILLFLTASVSLNAQTTLLSPTGDGGFENGTTFPANGWTLVNGATNQWFVGAVATPSAGTNSAYVSNDVAGTTYNYLNTAASTVHFYRDITFPAGETNIVLTFKWKCQGEASYDYVTVFSVPTTTTPVVNSPAGAFQSWLNIPTAYPGAVIHCTPPNLNVQSAYQTQTACFPASYAGTTRRVVFMWSNDPSVGTQPPGSIDEISIVSSVPVTPANQPTSLVLTPVSTSQIDGSFTAAAGPTDAYLVVRYPTGAAVTNPVNGTSYAVNASLGLGRVVASGVATTFMSTGLMPSTTYDYKVYSYNNSVCAGPQYQTSVAALSGTATTLSCVALAAGTYSVGPTGTYASLTAATAAINVGGTTGPVILELQSTYVSTVETFPIVLTNTVCPNIGGITIRPQTGATALSITSASPIGTINFDGGDNYTIDGRAGGTGPSQLTVSNTDLAGYAIQFINSATFNTVRYCTVAGVNTTATSGVILFNTAAGFATGNSNNTIDNCDIRDGATTPVNLLYATGTTTLGYANQNNNNVLSNNLFHDWFHATLTGAAINIVGACSDWTITGNSFYQTVARTFTMTVATDEGAIFINSITFGFNFTITNNFIGGSAPLCGGAPLTWNGGATGTPTPRMIRFSTSIGYPFSNISNNTIANIAVTTFSASTAHSLISHLNGNVNIDNNTLGSQSATGNITFTYTGVGTALQFWAIGYGTGASVSIINVTNNNIGGITIAPTSTGSVGFRIVYGQPVASSKINVTGNTIGGTVANSIQQLTNNITAAIMILNPTVDDIVNNNIIRNITHNNIGVTGSITGVNVQASGGRHTITGNTITNLSTNSTNVAINNASSICAITMTGSLIGGSNISNNTTHSLSNSNTTVAGWINGLYFATAVVPQLNTTIARNTVHSFSLASAIGTVGMAGIFLPNAGNSLCYNNTVRLGMDAAGASLTNPLQINGIYKASSGFNSIYHNSVYIGGTGVTGANASYAMRRTAVPLVGVDTCMNNIFYNARSNGAGTGKHYAVNLAVNTLLLEDNNLLLANGTGGVLGLLVAADHLTLAAWRTATDRDWNSVSSDPQFINPAGDAITGNLHIQAAVPTAVEQGGFLIPLVATDFDNQTRSALTPVDIGADAGNFQLLDQTPPVIYHTLVNYTCSTGDRLITGVNITDATGIPLAGGLVPKIYYRKNAGAYFSQSGTFVSGTATNSFWNFNIVAADMGGLVAADVVNYYIVAQDIVGTPNIGALPGGVVATDVNTIITPPVVPFAYTINATSLSGTYTVGAGGNYTTLKAAVDAYNVACLSGPVVFSLTQALYDATSGEVFPIQVNANPYASAVNTLTIKPTLPATVITGTALPGVITLNGADWVTIDGSISNTVNSICPPVTASRDLTIINTSTSTVSAVIWIQHIVATLNGATNNTVKNVNATGSLNTQTLCGIGSGSPTVGIATLGAGNHNNSFINNNIRKTQYGIISQGSGLSDKNQNTVVNQNLVNTASPDNVRIGGIYLGFENNTSISGNNISGILMTSSPDAFGIAVGMNNIAMTTFIGNEVTNAMVANNIIGSVGNTSSFASAGITVANAQSGTNTIVNNMINGVSANATPGDFVVGIFAGGGPGSTTNIYYNTVSMNGTGTGTSPVYALAIGGVFPTVDVRNNILSSTGTNGTGRNLAIGVAYAGSTGNYLNLISNNNDLFVSGATSSIGVTGTLNLSGATVPALPGVLRQTLADWQTETGRDLNSFSVLPTFVSSTDLHLQTGLNECMDGGGTPIAPFTTDIDCGVRNASTPDIGADEFINPLLVINETDVSGLANNDGIICSGASATLTTPAVGTYLWAPGGATTASITVSPTTTTTYTVTVTNQGCSATISSTITVNPTATVNPVANQVRCNGGTTAAVNFTGTGSPIFNWTNNTPSIGLVASGTGNIAAFTATNTGNSPVVATITVTPTNAFGCPGTPITFTITVNPTPTVNTVSNQTGCNSYATAAVNFSGNIGTTTYNWTNSAPSIGLAAAGSGNIASFTATNATNSPVVATITVTPTVNGCPGSPISFTITVNPSVLFTNTKVEPTTCVSNDGSINLTVTGGVAPFTFNWTGTGIINGNEDQVNLTVGTYFVTVTSANLCTSTASIVLDGPGGCGICPTVGALATTPTPNTCIGTTVTLSATGLQNMGNTYGIVFVNFPAATATPYTGGTILATVTNANLGGGGSTATATTTFASASTNFIYAILTPTPSSPICRPSATTTLTVNPTPTVNPVSSQTLCNGATTAAVTFTGAVNGTVYNWTNTAPAIGLAASGSGDIAAFTATNASNAPVVATIVVTPVFTAGNANCPGTPTSFTITVNPTPTVDAVANQIRCNGTATAAVNFTGNMGAAATYNWTNNTPSIGLVAAGSGNIASFTATNATNAPVTATITVTPTANNCPGASITFTITVNPTPTVDAVASQALCNGSQTTAVNFTGNMGAGATYNWTNNAPSIGLVAAGSGNIAAFMATNSTGAPIVATITVTPTANNCPGASITFTITVNPTPTVNAVASQVRCHNTATAAVNFTGNAGASAVYSWTNTNTAIGLAASGTGNIASFTATNPGLAPIFGTITVTPTYTNGAVTCTGTPISFTITVNPTPTVAAISSQTLCALSSTVGINFNGTVPGQTFTWTNNAPAIGLAASGSGTSIASFVAQNAGTTPIVATIVVTPVFPGVPCNGTTTTFTITVNPTPNQFTVTGLGAYCVGSQGSLIGLSGSQLGVNYQLLLNGNPVGGAIPGTGGAFSFGYQLGIGTYTVLATYATSGNCTRTMTGSVTTSTFVCTPAISDPCVCKDNATTLFNGQFNETIEVNAPDGMTWTVTAVSGLYTTASPLPPGAPIPIAIGTVLTPLGGNKYRLIGVHVDALGYTISVSNGAGTTLSIGNNCSYPNPVITAPDGDIYCKSSAPFALAGTPGDANITGSEFRIDGVIATQFIPANLSFGTHLISYKVFGGVAKAFGPNDPGCMQEVSKFVQVLQTSSFLSCNNNVQVSLGIDCETVVTPDMILEGDFGCYDDYQVVLSYNNGVILPTSPVVNSTHFNKIITAKITHLPSGNSCWGTLTVEDKIAPECSTTDVTLTCANIGNYSPNTIAGLGIPGAFPVVDENCPNFTTAFITQFTDLACLDVAGGLGGKNEVPANDEHGFGLITGTLDENTNVLTLTINYGGLTAGGLTAAHIHTGAAGANGPVAFPIALPNGTQSGSGTFTFNLSAGQVTTLKNSGFYVNLHTTAFPGGEVRAQLLWDLSGVARRTWTVTDASGNHSTCAQYIFFERLHNPDVIFPADITLNCENANTDPANTGSPNVLVNGQLFSVLGSACEMNVAYTDQVLDVCTGSYKILRTWTLYDWCAPLDQTPGTTTPNPIYFIQLIKVLDSDGPAILDCPVSLVPIVISVDPWQCSRNFDLPQLTVTENCSNISNAWAVYVNSVDWVAQTIQGSWADDPNWTGNILVNYGTIQKMPLGIHSVTFYVEDDCGNVSSCKVDYNVSDLIPPITICHEFTQVAIGGGYVDNFTCPGESGPNGAAPDTPGEAIVPATSFDNGSYDKCGPVWLKARRMDGGQCGSTTFDDAVKFCCSDIGGTWQVILRAYDVDPGSGAISADALDGHYNDCMVNAFVEDKVKPTCLAPSPLTVTCENFDPLVWYGNLSFNDNCGIKNIDTSLTYVPNQLAFEQCNYGQVRRTFTVVDCANNSSRCTQTITVNYKEQYRVYFPDDQNITTCNGSNTLVQPLIFGENCELIGISHDDQLFDVVPDACYKIIRTWKIINWCTYNPNQADVYIPNPATSTQGARIWIGGNAAGTAPAWANYNSGSPELPTVNQLMINYPASLVNPGTPAYVYDQVIKVQDQQPPTQAAIDPTLSTPNYDFCDYSSNDPEQWNEDSPYNPWNINNTWSPLCESHDLCEGAVDLSISGTDACTGANVNFRYLLFLDLNGDGVMEVTINSETPTLGFGIVETEVSGNIRIARVTRDFETDDGDHTKYPNFSLPYGNHKIKWILEDRCGNDFTKEYPISVRDCKNPTIVCINGLSVNQMNTPVGVMPPSVCLWATDFLQYTEDNCSQPWQIEIGIRDADINPGTGFPNNAAELCWDCSQIGTNSVELWARDKAGNADFCLTYLILSDNTNACDPSQSASVAGALKTKKQLDNPTANPGGVSESSVALKEVTAAPGIPPLSMFTSGDDGNFNFAAIPLLGTYKVVPKKDLNLLNGVSTFDLVNMSKHILGVKKFDSPYQWIAADINHNNQVTTFDIVELRKLILGVYTDLPANDSWRFVDKNYVFTSPNPLSEPFNELIEFQTSGVPNLDFVGVKIGDLNGDVLPNNFTQADDRTFGTLVFETADRAVKAGEIVDVKFTATEKTEGAQFTLTAANGFEMLEIIPENGLSAENFALFAGDNLLTASFHGLENAASFTVKFRATTDGQLSQMLNVSNRVTRAEAWKLKDGSRLEVALGFRNSNGSTTVNGLGFELYQNEPNPFVDKTAIGFHLPEAAEATLTIFDASGKRVFEQSGQFAKGSHSILIDKNQLSAPASLLYYQLSTGTNTATKSLIIVR